MRHRVAYRLNVFLHLVEAPLQGQPEVHNHVDFLRVIVHGAGGLHGLDLRLHRAGREADDGSDVHALRHVDGQLGRRDADGISAPLPGFTRQLLDLLARSFRLEEGVIDHLGELIAQQLRHLAILLKYKR